MPELQQDAPALRVHGIDDRLPALHLIARPDARRAGIADAHGLHRGRLGQDHARRRPLRVVLAHQAVRHAPRHGGAVARQRRHDDAVGKLQLADGERLKQLAHDHLISRMTVAPAASSSRKRRRKPGRKPGCGPLVLCSTIVEKDRRIAAAAQAVGHDLTGRRGSRLCERGSAPGRAAVRRPAESQAEGWERSCDRHGTELPRHR